MCGEAGFGHQRYISVCATCTAAVHGRGYHLHTGSAWALVQPAHWQRVGAGVTSTPVLHDRVCQLHISDAWVRVPPATIDELGLWVALGEQEHAWV